MRCSPKAKQKIRFKGNLANRVSFYFRGCDDLGREAFVALVRRRRLNMSIGSIILIILVIALLGGFSGIGGGPFYGMGYYGGGGLGIVVLVLLVLVLLGKL
jgi:hypothetical protein